MTIALPAEAARRPRHIDLSWPILALFAAVLCVLILLPMSWLVYYSLVDRTGAFTLENFTRLVSDPTFVDPLITTVIIATSSSAICCIVAAPMGWLVARTDMPLRRTVRALVTASFVTPPFLGAIAWELLAAPNSGLINKAWRAATGAGLDEALFNIYSLGGLIFVISCYTFPYVFVLIANALDRIPGDLEDASVDPRRQHLDDRAAHHHPAGDAGAAGRRAGRLPAGDDAVRLAGDPGAAGRLPHHDHQNLEPVPVSAQARTGGGGVAAAPGVDGVAAARRAHDSRPPRLFGGGRQAGRSAPGQARPAQMGGARRSSSAVLLCPVFLPYAALFNAAFSRVASQFISFSNFTLHNINFVFFELSATKLAVKNTFVLGILSATIGTILALVISYVTTRKAITGYRALGFLATAPIAIPGIVLGVALFLTYARPPFVLYGTLWILLIAFVTIALPAAYQQMQSAFRSVHTDLEDASRILGATRLRVLRDITAPLLRTSVIATWCFIFVGVMRELSAAIMLFTSETKVISVLIFDLNEIGRPRRHFGARARHAFHHLRRRRRREPHSGLRRRALAQYVSIHGR